MRTSKSLLALALFVGGCQEVTIATCPNGTVEEQGQCRVECSDTAACLASELCDGRVCVPVEDDGRATIRIFRATADRIRKGDAVTLEWVTSNATSVEIQPGFGAVSPSDTAEVTPLQTTTYQMTARGQTDDDSAQVTVEVIEDVVGELEIVEFVEQGAGCGDIGVRWIIRTPSGTDDGLSVRIEDESQQTLATSSQAVGSAMVDIDKSMMLTLIASLDREQTSRSVHVDVTPICEFFATPPEGGLEGDTAIVEWNVRNAQSILLRDADSREVLHTRNGVFARPDGFWLVEPQPPVTRYELEVVDGGGQTSIKHIEVGVQARSKPPVIKRFELIPAVASPGDSVTVYWEVLDADTAQVQRDGVSIGETVAGSEIVIVDRTTTFAISAENGDGVVTRSLLSLIVLDEIEPNDSYNSATPLLRAPMRGGPTRLTAVDGTSDFATLTSDYYYLPLPATELLRVGTVSTNAPNSNCSGLSIRLSTPNGATILPSSMETTVDGCQQLTFASLGSGNYYVIIDASLVEISVDYRLVVDPSPPTCGDGVREGFEGCDAGDIRNGDGCSATCSVENEFVYGPPQEGGMAPTLGQTARDLEFLPYDGAGAGTVVNSAYSLIRFEQSFNFYGRKYWGVVVHRDGYLSFTPDFTFHGLPNGIPATGRPNPAIYVFGTDLSGGDVLIPRLMPNGAVAVIEYRNMTAAADGSSVTAQVVLTPSGQVLLSYPGRSTQNLMFLSGFEGPFGRFGEFATREGCSGGRCNAGRIPSDWVVSFSPIQ